VYFHNDGAIQTKKEASLKVNGTSANPVFFSGDRLEPWYSNVPGQWLGVFLEDESVDHELSFLYLKNAQNGLFCEADAKTDAFALSLTNCSFINCSAQGLYFKNTSVQAYNLLAGNCVSNELLIELGGSYEFNHATFGNYTGTEAGSSNSGNSVSIKNWGNKDGDMIDADLVKCDFYNSIIYGVTENELTLSDNGAVFNYSVNYSLLAVQGESNSSNEFTACVFGKDPLFNEVSEGDFLLTANSPAIDIADLNVVQSKSAQLGADLKSDNRTVDDHPDAGVYEFIP